MSTQFKSRLVQYALFVGATREAQAWLMENAPKMAAADKVDADLAVVKALEERYGVEASESSRPEFSGWSFKHDAAKQALYRARLILRGGKARKSKAQVDKVARLLKAFASLSASEKRRFLKSAE